MIHVDVNALSATDGILRQSVVDQDRARQLADARERLLGAGNRSAVRPRSAEEAGIRRQDARVEVRARVEEGELKMEVAVYSLMRPGAFKRVLLDRRDPSAAVQVAAGACAEGCCEQFGDPFDPSQAADAALEAYRRLRAA